MDEMAALEAKETAAAEAVAVFEADWAKIDEEWRARRRAVNDTYREAACALEAARVAAADPDRPAPSSITIGEAG